MRLDQVVPSSWLTWSPFPILIDWPHLQSTASSRAFLIRAAQRAFRIRQFITRAFPCSKKSQLPQSGSLVALAKLRYLVGRPVLIETDGRSGKSVAPCSTEVIGRFFLFQSSACSFAVKFDGRTFPIAEQRSVAPSPQG